MSYHFHQKQFTDTKRREREDGEQHTSVPGRAVGDDMRSRCIDESGKNDAHFIDDNAMG